MTWLWTALIVVGVVMIAMALWPSLKRRGTTAPGQGERPENQ